MSGQISHTEYQELLDAFKIFDRDDSGKITRSEMYQLSTALELDIKDENELNELIKQIDLDGDGNICFSEFLKLMGYTDIVIIGNTKYTNKEITDAFNFFDKNGDGTIDSRELRHAVYRLTKKRYRNKKISDMIKSVDRKGEGTVSLEEFKDLMQNYL